MNSQLGVAASHRHQSGRLSVLAGCLRRVSIGVQGKRAAEALVHLTGPLFLRGGADFALLKELLARGGLVAAFELAVPLLVEVVCECVSIVGKGSGSGATK